MNRTVIQKFRIESDATDELVKRCHTDRRALPDVMRDIVSQERRRGKSAKVRAELISCPKIGRAHV